MRILIIQPWLSYRGAETVSLAFADGMKRLGHDPIMAAVYVDEGRAARSTQDIPIFTPAAPLCLLCRSHPLIFLALAPGLLFILVMRLSRDVDVLNAHNPPSLLIAALVGWIKGIPVIWTCHSLPVSVKWSRRVSLLDFLAKLLAGSSLERWAVKRAAIVIANSRRTARQLRTMYAVDSHIEYPPLGDVPWRSSRTANYARRASRIIVASHFDARKNQAGAIAAFSRVRDVIPHAELILAGDGPLASILEDLVSKERLEDCVSFPGYVPSEKLCLIYEASQVALMPAFNEPWGLTPFEALAAGCVPIVSSQSGAAEVIREKEIGFVCDPHPEAMADAIIEALLNKERSQQMVRQGRKYLLEALTVDGYSRACEAVFNKSVLRHSKSKIALSGS